MSFIVEYQWYVALVFSLMCLYLILAPLISTKNLSSIANTQKNPPPPPLKITAVTHKTLLEEYLNYEKAYHNNELSPEDWEKLSQELRRRYIELVQSSK